MAKRVALPNGLVCETGDLPKAPLPDDVIAGTEMIDPDGLTTAGWQGEIPKIEAYASLVGNDPTNPTWLCDHAYGHCADTGPAPEPVCDACEPWLNYWSNQDFPNGVIKPNSGKGPQNGVHGFNSFTNLCGLWCTTDFFAESCSYFDPSQVGMPKNVVEYAIVVASEILYRVSGRQYTSMCERVVLPGCDRTCKLSPAYNDSHLHRDTDYSSGAFSGSSCCSNTTCDTCYPDSIELPGPINSVIEIVIDGVILPSSAYRIIGHKKLVRVDGGTWPNNNNLTRSPYDVEDPANPWDDCSQAWLVRYYQGKCPPLMGQLAAAALAKTIADDICVEKCLPNNTARITAEGLDVRLISRFQSIYKNHKFGIKEVDTFLAASNPSDLRRSGYARRPGGNLGKPRVISVRNSDF